LRRESKAHSVVHHQRGYRSQRDAGGGQIACLPGEVGDSDVNGMAAVIWLIGWAKSTWLVSQIRTPSAPRPDRTTPRSLRPARPAESVCAAIAVSLAGISSAGGTPDNHLMFLELLM